MLCQLGALQHLLLAQLAVRVAVGGCQGELTNPTKGRTTGMSLLVGSNAFCNT